MRIFEGKHKDGDWGEKHNFIDDKEKFLHIFNCHNGYYGHTFIMEIKGKQTLERCL